MENATQNTTFLDMARERWSVRKFKQEQIGDEHLVHAATAAVVLASRRHPLAWHYVAKAVGFVLGSPIEPLLGGGVHQMIHVAHLSPSLPMNPLRWYKSISTKRRGQLARQPVLPLNSQRAPRLNLRPKGHALRSQIGFARRASWKPPSLHENLVAQKEARFVTKCNRFNGWGDFGNNHDST